MGRPIARTGTPVPGMTMDLKVKEVVTFNCKVVGIGAYDGQQCQILRPCGHHKVQFKSGTQAELWGYVVRFSDGKETVVKPEYLRRGTLERGDMDRILTWDYVFKTIGWRPREGE